ncbi:hypothetical protein [Caldicellulosiruptor sp. DIB 104C]|uniref:hypothetical protein n=1 Tax=Caldicellulosiruptor sp. DIB 104C TaxID=3019889 RepID=UPI002306B331|nr:hypothetical protein [Caldicellulosiruptor sp. DIB 104C]
MKEWGLLIDDVKDILLDLQPGDYVKGPEQDHLDNKEGDIWIFKNNRYLDVCNIHKTKVQSTRRSGVHFFS